MSTSTLSLKFLVSNAFAGSLIGSHGKSIKELIEVTQANVYVSSAKDTFPGTQDRVILVTGEIERMMHAIALILELAAANGQSLSGLRDWSPNEMSNNIGRQANTFITLRITIPSAAGGLVIGREGATLRSMSETSGARGSMSNKEDSIFTLERIMTVSGTVMQIKRFIELLLHKLEEDPEASQYANKGTKYFAINALNKRSANSNNSNPPSRDIPRVPSNMGIVASDTTITMQVDESLIGFILGKKGATLKEIQSLSEAKVVVSPRGTFVEGTNNRTVTISGTSRAANTALRFCTEKVKQGQRGKTREAEEATK